MWWWWWWWISHRLSGDRSARRHGAQRARLEVHWTAASRTSRTQRHPHARMVVTRTRTTDVDRRFASTPTPFVPFVFQSKGSVSLSLPFKGSLSKRIRTFHPASKTCAVQHLALDDNASTHRARASLRTAKDASAKRGIRRIPKRHGGRTAGSVDEDLGRWSGGRNAGRTAPGTDGRRRGPGGNAQLEAWVRDVVHGEVPLRMG